MHATVKEYFVDFFELFFPNLCVICQNKLLKGEEVVCLHCESELPVTNYYTNPDNPVAKRLWARIEVQGAAALLQFRKGGNVQHLIHQLKYKGRQDVGRYLGKNFANQLKGDHSIFKNIDVVVPVPLFWKKEQKRGYNQCTSFGQSLAESLNIPFVENALMRRFENPSQTTKKRYDRWGNVEGIFSVVDSSPLENKHILLVDDVFTTGATAEACLQEILHVPGTRVSFLSIAISM